MVYLWLFLFFALVIIFWVTNLLGAPGNWFIIAIAAVWALIGPEEYRFGWGVVIGLIVIALIGEGIEFGTSVLGTKKLGGSARGATLSVIGSIVGGIVGVLMGLPIPVPLLGPLVGSILFASTGALIGAIIGEQWVGKPVTESLKIGGAAFIGRLLGTVGKLIMGSAMVALAIAAPFFF